MLALQVNPESAPLTPDEITRPHAAAIVRVARSYPVINATPDLASIVLDQRLLDAFAEGFFAIFHGLKAINVIGLESAGVPLLAAISLKAAGRGIAVGTAYVRRERHWRDTRALIQGALVDGPYIFVDDLIDTGLSAERVRALLAATGNRLIAVLAAVTTENPNAMTWADAYGIAIGALTRWQDIWPEIPPTRRQDHRTETQTRLPAATRIGIPTILSWRAPTPDNRYITPKSQLVIDTDTIFMGCDDNALHAFDSATLSHRWTFQTPTAARGLWSTPAVALASVFLGCMAGRAYRIDQATGALLWEVDLGSPCIGRAHIDEGLGFCFFPTHPHNPYYAGNIVAVDCHTGDVVWRIETHGAFRDFCFDFAKRRLYCATRTRDVYCIDASSGGVIWNKPAGETHAPPALTQDGNTLLVSDVTGVLYRLSAATGTVVDTLELGAHAVVAMLPLEDQLVVPLIDGRLLGLTPDGSAILSDLPTGGAFYCAPALVNSQIWIGNNASRLMVLDAQSWDLIATSFLPDRIVGGLASAGGLVYARTNEDHLYGLRLQSATFETLPSVM